MRRNDPATLHEKVLDRSVAGSNGCIEFAGEPSQRYPRIRCNYEMLRASHVVYEALVGPVPEGLQLDHLCLNTRCVNPSHLEPVTQRENILRSRGLGAQNARKTHCKRGHPLEGKNLYINPKGERQCRKCAGRRHKEWIIRKREAST